VLTVCHLTGRTEIWDCTDCFIGDFDEGFLFWCERERRHFEILFVAVVGWLVFGYGYEVGVVFMMMNCFQR
jgi:hypothetical protein